MVPALASRSQLSPKLCTGLSATGCALSSHHWCLSLTPAKFQLHPTQMQRDHSVPSPVHELHYFFSFEWLLLRHVTSTIYGKLPYHFSESLKNSSSAVATIWSVGLVQFGALMIAFILTPLCLLQSSGFSVYMSLCSSSIRFNSDYILQFLTLSGVGCSLCYSSPTYNQIRRLPTIISSLLYV